LLVCLLAWLSQRKHAFSHGHRTKSSGIREASSLLWVCSASFASTLCDQLTFLLSRISFSLSANAQPGLVDSIRKKLAAQKPPKQVSYDIDKLIRENEEILQQKAFKMLLNNALGKAVNVRHSLSLSLFLSSLHFYRPLNTISFLSLPFFLFLRKEIRKRCKICCVTKLCVRSFTKRTRKETPCMLLCFAFACLSVVFLILTFACSGCSWL
jgi:hypothetical protein